MKYSSYFKISLAVLAFAGAQSSGAAVLAGFHDFVGAKLTNPPPNNPADVVAAGFVAWAESPYSATGNGGCLDGFYGTSSIAVPATPIGDGFASIKMVGTNSTTLKFVLTNNSGYSVSLSDLFFDGAATSGQPNRYVKVDFVNAMGTTTLGTSGPLTSTSPQNFDDYTYSLGNYMMANMETVSFVFTAPAGAPNGTVLWIDNVAIVPEASSLMAFGCMVMTGLMFRSRRK